MAERKKRPPKTEKGEGFTILPLSSDVSRLHGSANVPIDPRYLGTLASEIKKEEVEWLIYPYVPLRQLSFVAGNTSVGKSTFLAWIVSQAKRACALPGYEETISTMTIARMERNGVTMRNVRFLNKHRFTIPRDRKILTAVLRDHGASLLTIDPIDSYLDEGIEQTDYNGVRGALETFSQIAEEANVAIVAVRHIGKDVKNVTPGIRPWRDVPRQVTLLFKDAHYPPRYYVKLHKDNNGTREGVREFRLDFGKGKVPKFILMEKVDSSIDELSNVSDGNTGRRQITEAAKLIRHMFEESGEPLCADLKNECLKNGISDRARNEAKTLLGIDQKPGGKGGSWIMYRTTKEWPSWVPEVEQ